MKMNEPTLLGEVISVAGSSLLIELTPHVSSGLLIIEGKTYKIGQVGSFVRIPQGYNDLYGVISETNESALLTGGEAVTEKRIVKVELVGESIGSEFERGIGQYPNINDDAHIVTEYDLLKIYGGHRGNQVKIGKLSSSDSIDVTIDLDSLINRHSALLGSTGSGKSTSVSSLLRSIVSDEYGSIVRPSSRVVLFDLHGEYSSALSDIANVYSINPNKNEHSLEIPYWCVNPESLIDFLCGSNENLKNVFLDKIVLEKREFVTRNSIEFDVDKITPYTPFPFRLRRIWYDLCMDDSETWKDKEKTIRNFISKGDALKLEAPTFKPPDTTKENLSVKGGQNVWKKQLTLMRSRLLDAQYAFFLDPGDWDLKDDFSLKFDLDKLISNWIGLEQPITIIDLSGLPSARLDLLLGSALDLLYEAAIWSKSLPEGMKETPLLIVLEEAHKYLSNETNGLSKTMVRKIAKEGRKFGVGSMLISQRPSEVDETILSQCGTLIALRINNSTDRGRVKSAMSDSLSGIVDTLPILRTGEAIITGEAVKLPIRCKFKTPKDDQFPDSRDPAVSESWSKSYIKNSFSTLLSAWRFQSSQLEETKKEEK